MAILERRRHGGRGAVAEDDVRRGGVVFLKDRIDAASSRKLYSNYLQKWKRQGYYCLQ